MIQSAAITMPTRRGFSMLGRHGHLDREADPQAAWRLPFRINGATIEGEKIDATRALGVLTRLERDVFANGGYQSPQGAWWAKALSQVTPVWEVWLSVTYATPSLDPTSSGLATVPAATYIAVGWGSETPFGTRRTFQNLTPGLHEIDEPRRTLLQR